LKRWWLTHSSYLTGAGKGDCKFGVSAARRGLQVCHICQEHARHNLRRRALKHNVRVAKRASAAAQQQVADSAGARTSFPIRTASEAGTRHVQCVGARPYVFVVAILQQERLRPWGLKQSMKPVAGMRFLKA
jgi:hypothetical protein